MKKSHRSRLLKVRADRGMLLFPLAVFFFFYWSIVDAQYCISCKLQVYGVAIPTFKSYNLFMIIIDYSSIPHVVQYVLVAYLKPNSLYL